MSSDILQSTLNDLSHLAVQPSELTFEDEAEIGAGGYGEVFLATLARSSTAPVKVAVKQLRMVQAKAVRRRVALRLARELKVWASANHPNILELVGYYLSENLGSAQLISPYMSNGNVKDYIKINQPAAAIRLQFVRGITSGIYYLHGCNPPICHGDLKPPNVLVNDNIEAVLCDFGLATFITESGASSGLTTSRSPKGSLRYMSPELLQESEAKHSLESDIWAWGCTVFEVVTDSEPYSNANRDIIVMRYLMLGKPPGSVDLFNNVAHEDTTSARTLDRLKSIIPACWTTDPTDRPSSSEIFNHLAFLLGKDASYWGDKDVPEEEGTGSQVGRHRESGSRPLAASDGKRASGKPKVVYALAPLQQNTDTSASGAESPSIAIAGDNIEEDYEKFPPRAAPSTRGRHRPTHGRGLKILTLAQKLGLAPLERHTALNADREDAQSPPISPPPISPLGDRDLSDEEIEGDHDEVEEPEPEPEPTPSFITTYAQEGVATDSEVENVLPPRKVIAEADVQTDAEPQDIEMPIQFAPGPVADVELRSMGISREEVELPSNRVTVPFPIRPTDLGGKVVTDDDTTVPAQTHPILSMASVKTARPVGMIFEDAEAETETDGEFLDARESMAPMTPIPADSLSDSHSAHDGRPSGMIFEDAEAETETDEEFLDARESMAAVPSESEHSDSESIRASRMAVREGYTSLTAQGRRISHTSRTIPIDHPAPPKPELGDEGIQAAEWIPAPISLSVPPSPVQSFHRVGTISNTPPFQFISTPQRTPDMSFTSSVGTVTPTQATLAVPAATRSLFRNSGATFGSTRVPRSSTPSIVGRQERRRSLESALSSAAPVAPEEGPGITRSQILAVPTPPIDRTRPPVMMIPPPPPMPPPSSIPIRRKNGSPPPRPTSLPPPELIQRVTTQTFRSNTPSLHVPGSGRGFPRPPGASLPPSPFRK